ncbi:MAG: hypothetical protein IKX44_02185 [Prevotella sp.]|nr:hypothetical protein [Prevotella sp.]
MKRILIMLLIAGSAITTACAQKKIYPNTPQNVIGNLNLIINLYGNQQGQTYSVTKNPNTNLIESSERIVHFTAFPGDAALVVLPQDFMKDEPFSYQFLHIMPGNNQKFSIPVVTSDMRMSRDLPIRTKNTQEMWYMACKNPENPQLRDVYAIVWEEKDVDIVGTIYMITSLRPDIYEKEMETSKKIFKIEGRVDANIKDSLYNIYIADSYAALNAVGDDDYVACVPVVNKRFEYQTELDRPMVGRLRCIFPDGELCSAWIDLDFVPGETYHITVHNGYYDDDKDYERRVGRLSGRSLIYTDRVVEADETLQIDSLPAAVQSQLSPYWVPSPQVLAQLEAKKNAINANVEAIQATYAALKPFLDMKSLTGTDRYFLQISMLNKELDTKMKDFIKLFNSTDSHPSMQADRLKALSSMYKEFLNFYIEQNKGFMEIYKEVGVLTKEARSTQKYINKLIEKYMEEMTQIM